jgi:hypothetical protein
VGEGSDKRMTEKMLPVLLGENYKHVMARASIEQKAAQYGRDDQGNRVLLQEAEVLITISAKGGHAQELGDFVAATEVVALSFSGVPVRPSP